MPRRDCPRVMKFCMGYEVTRKTRFGVRYLFGETVRGCVRFDSKAIFSISRNTTNEWPNLSFFWNTTLAAHSPPGYSAGISNYFVT